MTVFKQYNSSTSQWETIVTGTQGPAGAAGSAGATGPSYNLTTSTQTITFGTGNRNFGNITNIGAFVVGNRVRAASTTNPTTEWLEGVITGITASTPGAVWYFSVLVDSFVGSGSVTRTWNIGIAGSVGATGATGATGGFSSTQETYAPTFTSNNYTLITSDLGKMVRLNNGATAGTVTVNTSLGLTAGQSIDLLHLTGNTLTVVASGVTVNATPGLKLRTTYSAASLFCVGTNDYVLIGDLSA
jgi:hypothetical protein